MKYNRTNLVSLKLTGPVNTVTCRHCGASQTFPVSDAFVPGPMPNFKNGGKSLIDIPTPQKFVAYFLDSHMFQHEAEEAERQKRQSEQRAEAAV